MLAPTVRRADGSLARAPQSPGLAEHAHGTAQARSVVDERPEEREAAGDEERVEGAEQ